jgi:hypothetical protein
LSPPGEPKHLSLLDHDDAIDATPPVVIGYATYLDAQLVGTTEDVK